MDPLRGKVTRDQSKASSLISSFASLDLGRAPWPFPSEVLLFHWDVNGLPLLSSTPVCSSDFGIS